MSDKILTDSGVSRLSTNAKGYINRRVAELTQSQYDALPIATKMNGSLYFLTDTYKIMFNDKAYAAGGDVPIELPIASSTTLGGIKVGTGLTIAQDGTLSVYKEPLTVPAQSGTITYDGTSKSPTWNNNYDSTKMTVSGDTAGTNAGTYTATFSLIDPTSYEWSDGTTTDKTVTWSINKAQGNIDLYSQSVKLDLRTTSKTYTVNITGDGTLHAESNDTNIATVSVSGNKLTVTAVNDRKGTAIVTVYSTATTNYTASSTRALSLTVQTLNLTVFGAEWTNGSENTAWTRTDGAAQLAEPVPALGNSYPYQCSSPYDNYYPWRGMTTATDTTAGDLVRIPKFWYKLTISNGKISLKIANQATTGFKVAPAFQARNSYYGELDYIYVGRTLCTSDYTASKNTNRSIITNISRDDARTGIRNLSQDCYQIDWATMVTLWMLYLVEYADWNFEKKIGAGGLDISSETPTSCVAINGVRFHTGTTATARNQKGRTVYRNIEDLGNFMSYWVDGISLSVSDVYIIKDPTKFTDTPSDSVGTKIGTLPYSSYTYGFVKEYSQFSNSDYDWFLYPSLTDSNTQNTKGKYACASFLFNGRHLSNTIYSGNYNYSAHSDDKGVNVNLFDLNITSPSSSYVMAGRTCRLMKLA